MRCFKLKKKRTIVLNGSEINSHLILGWMFEMMRGHTMAWSEGQDQWPLQISDGAVEWRYI
jgi:hypothetical protein